MTEKNVTSNALLAHYNVKSTIGYYLQVFVEPVYSRPRSVIKRTIQNRWMYLF